MFNRSVFSLTCQGMFPGFGNCTGLTEVKFGCFLIGFLFGWLFFLVGKYQIMATDVIPPKLFAIKRTQYPRCRWGWWQPPCRGAAGSPRSPERSVLCFAL